MRASPIIDQVNWRDIYFPHALRIQARQELATSEYGHRIFEGGVMK
jgi:hypothetical protein